MQELLTPSEAAKVIENITPAGVVAASKRGALPISVRTPSGRRLYSRQDALAFKQRRTAAAVSAVADEISGEFADAVHVARVAREPEKVGA